MLQSDMVIAAIQELRNLGRDHAEVQAKRAWGGLPRDIWKPIVAFANKHGGLLLLGVDESSGFKVTGVEEPGARSDGGETRSAVF